MLCSVFTNFTFLRFYITYHKNISNWVQEQNKLTNTNFSKWHVCTVWYSIQYDSNNIIHNYDHTHTHTHFLMGHFVATHIRTSRSKTYEFASHNECNLTSWRTVLFSRLLNGFPPPGNMENPNCQNPLQNSVKSHILCIILLITVPLTGNK